MPNLKKSVWRNKSYGVEPWNTLKREPWRELMFCWGGWNGNKDKGYVLSTKLKRGKKRKKKKNNKHDRQGYHIEQGSLYPNSWVNSSISVSPRTRSVPSKIFICVRETKTLCVCIWYVCVCVCVRKETERDENDSVPLDCL